MPTLTPEQEALKHASLALSAGDSLSNNDYSNAQDKYEDLATPAAILALLAQLEAVQAAPSVPAQTGTVMLAGGGGALKTAETRMDTGFGGGAEIAIDCVLTPPSTPIPGSARQGGEQENPRQQWEMADQLCKEGSHGMLTYHAEAFDAGKLAALQQPVQADRRIAWFDALTQRAESMGFVSIEDALDGFDATRKATEDRAMRPVQAIPDGWKLVPIDLTEEMTVAFAEVWYAQVRCIDDCEMDDCYAAMLDAAPTALGEPRQ